MKISKQLAIIPSFFLFVACAFSQDVHYNYQRGANFSSYHTYQWVDAQSTPAKADTSTALPDPPAPPPGAPSLPGLPALPRGGSDVRNSATMDPLIDQDIKRAVDEQLGGKGLTKVDKNPDLLIAYHTALRQETSINLNGFGWGGRGYGGMWDGNVNGQTSTIPVGTLVVDLYDLKNKQLIWRGDASKTIELKKDQDKNYKQLQKAMTKLFKNYPPPAGK